MTNLILVRHLPTNMAGRFCGQSDPELNEQGRSQIPCLLNTLSEYPIQRVYSSDLRRAQQTAKAIATHFEAELHLRPGLREIDFGLWEGLSWSAIKSRDQSAAKRWADAYPNSTAPGGESVEQFQSRVREEIVFLMEQSANSSTAAVTHAGLMRLALTMYGVREPEAWNRTRDYGSIVVLDVNRIDASADEFAGKRGLKRFYKEF